jgi:hypothetical protein
LWCRVATYDWRQTNCLYLSTVQLLNLAESEWKESGKGAET